MWALCFFWHLSCKSFLSHERYSNLPWDLSLWRVVRMSVFLTQHQISNLINIRRSTLPTLDNTSTINFANKMIYGYCAQKCRNVDIFLPSYVFNGAILFELVVGKLQWRDYPKVKNFYDKFSLFVTTPKCHGSMDGISISMWCMCTFINECS